MRFRDDNPQELARARAAVSVWRKDHPAGTAEQLTTALGPQFPPRLRGRVNPNWPHRSPADSSHRRNTGL